LYHPSAALRESHAAISHSTHRERRWILFIDTATEEGLKKQSAIGCELLLSGWKAAKCVFIEMIKTPNTMLSSSSALFTWSIEVAVIRGDSEMHGR
jgi:hypothetical protein